MSPIAHLHADIFLLGFVVASSLIAALFFLRFWRDTRDPLFVAFSAFSRCRASASCTCCGWHIRMRETSGCFCCGFCRSWGFGSDSAQEYEKGMMKKKGH